MDNAEQKNTANPQYWLAEHGDSLYSYAMSRVMHAETARDLVQETLIAAWKARGNFRGDASPRTWLIGILKHKIIDHVRREVHDRNLKEQVETDPTSSWFSANGSWIEAPRAWSDNPEGMAENEQLRKVLADCIGKLPGKQRMVFSMREMAGEDSETICNEADITATNLHVMLHRARMALRRCLEINWFGDRSAS